MNALSSRTGASPLSYAWWRARPLALVAAGITLAVTLAATWYLASPLVIRTSLQEAAPIQGAPLARGRFSDRDAIHRGSGVATLVRTTGGGHGLQLDEFRVTNGPDLYVYLIPTAFRAAVIYCLQFRTIFSVAPLSPA